VPVPLVPPSPLAPPVPAPLVPDVPLPLLPAVPVAPSPAVPLVEVPPVPPATEVPPPALPDGVTLPLLPPPLHADASNSARDVPKQRILRGFTGRLLEWGASPRRYLPS
jgi:hypothetical protein